jgi:hypothetical protein
MDYIFLVEVVDCPEQGLNDAGSCTLGEAPIASGVLDYLLV